MGLENKEDAGKVMTINDEMLNDWAEGKSGVAAFVLAQPLKPVVGRTVFPPTFAPAKTGAPTDYIIDTIGGKNVVTLDTPGSHANRLEPVFMKKPYIDLVPQVVISGGEKSVPFSKNLLELGHRAADALARSSEGAETLTSAFQKVVAGDASALAEIAPTSLVFGVWDSRGTGAKIPRVVQATIRAEDVEKLHRAAQYFSAVRFDEVDLLPKAKTEAERKKRSEAGFLDAPSGHQVGGVDVHGAITRTVSVNLVTIAALGAGKDTDKGEALRQYILGLALAAATAPIPLYLRQGCFLVADGKAQWQMVKHDGVVSPVDLKIAKILEYAEGARDRFFKREKPQEITWKAKKSLAENELKKRTQGSD
jgi:CRISPR-associated protein Csb1